MTRIVYCQATWREDFEDVRARATMTTCLNCGKPTDNPKFCSRVCSNRYHMKDKRIIRKISGTKKGVTREEMLGKERAEELRAFYHNLMLGNKNAQGTSFSEEVRRRVSEKLSGPNNPMYGKTHTEEARRKMESTWFKRGRTPWNKDYGGYMEGENNPNWLGGISFEPYDPEFNDELKEQIRARDDYTCQLCRTHQTHLKRLLSTHHIDYNKENNDPSNLTSLCNSCNARVNYDRGFWTDYFVGVLA